LPGPLASRVWKLSIQSEGKVHAAKPIFEILLVLRFHPKQMPAQRFGQVQRERIGEQTLTIPQHGGVLVGPEHLRQVFNDTEAEVLWLIVGAPEQELEPGETLDQKLVYPVDPKQLPKELDGVAWPPKS
jgi:hypothetical protein